jgi:hypothetical protein
VLEPDVTAVARAVVSGGVTKNGRHEAEAAYPSPSPGPDDPAEHPVLGRIADLESRLTDVQQLAGRTYEHAQGWPSIIDAARRTPGYERAYVDDEPLISIPIATYQGGEILCERALASVRRQGYERWEAIVVGDHTQDDTAERIAAIGDPRIRFHNLPYRGPYPDNARARWYVAGTAPANTALRMCAGSWIAPQDHDDAWADDHLEVLLTAARDHRAELAYGQVEVFTEATGERETAGEFPPRMGAFWFQSSLYHHALTRFEFDENCRFVGEPGDWNRARRMWEAGVRFHFVDRVVGTYHYAPRHREPTADERLFEELRSWAEEMRTGMEWWQKRCLHAEEGLEWWKARADRFEAELATERSDG